MFGNYAEDIDRKKAVVAMLIQLANVDEGEAHVERRFIRDVAEQLGLKTSELQEVIDNPDGFPLKPPKEEQERMNILYYLLFTMRVDGVIKEEEERLCYKAGLRLGFNEHLTADLIRVMKTYLHEDIPTEAMLNAIRKYLN